MTFRHSLTFQIGMLMMASLITACGSTFDNLDDGGATDDSTRTIVSTANVTINWGSDDTVKSGIGVTNLSMAALTDTGGDGTETNFPTCFENSRACRRAHSTILSSILNNPVVVQGFQLNFTFTDYSVPGRTYSSIAIDAASVTTAELRFNGTTGELALGTPYTKQLVNGATCTLGSTYAVGYTSSNKILVGLRLYEEGQQATSNANTYLDSHMTAARVWHSGLYPDGSNVSLPMGFKFVPEDDAETVDFGISNFTESSAGTAVSPYFGLNGSDPVSGGYKNHVIVGFCLQGRKIGTSTRPLLLYSEAYVRTPKIQKVK